MSRIKKIKNKKINILFVNSRTPDNINKEYYLPLGLLYLASSAEKVGCSAKILDFNIYSPHLHNNPAEFCNQILKQKILEYKPGVIVLGCLFSGQILEVIQLSEKIKDISQEIITILGGIHATSYPYDILNNCQSIDFVILGEGERTLQKILNKFQSDNINFEDIDGFAYRNETNSIIINKKTTFIENLDDIPFPAYHLINLKDYYYNTSGWHNPKKLPINASIPIITSRGCPIGCSFCSMSSVMGRKCQRRSVENVFSELELLYNHYGHTYFSIMDDNFSLDKKFVLKLCDKITESNLNIQFDTLNGLAVNTLDSDVIDALVRAGLARIALAIESGSPEIRKQMGKHLSQKKIFEVVKLLKKYPFVLIRGFFIIGMPEDTSYTLNETYDLIRKIDIHRPEINNIIPFPGTKIYNQCQNDKLFSDSLDLKEMWNTSFAVSNSNDYFFIKPYNISIEELLEWRIKFNNLMNEAKSRVKQNDIYCIL